MADAEPDSSASAIDRAITSVLASLDGISELKCEQEKALKAFLSGEDVLALLPTGFGKSLIYQLVPLVCKAYLQTEGERSSLFPGVENPIVIVVSPLVALMEDQVKEAAKLGITAAQLGGTSDNRILSGSVQLVFGSPESWILNDKWRTMLASARYRRNLVGIVVDEVHMMHKWGQGKKGKPAFREAFSRLGELRSLVKEGTPILALTASADIPSRERVISLLNMQGAQRIHVSPNKENIRLGLMKVPRDDLRCLDWVVKSIRDNGESAPQTIIYCKSIKAIGMVYHYLQAELAEDAWVDKDPERKTKNHLIGIFHGNTLPKHKQNVLSALSEDGNCRVIAATTALGMGMNFPKVSSVILYGPPADTEGVLQQFGRAGRDGSAVNAILYYHGTQLIKSR
ncbi:PREDICTED: ATP-dependent DNA helicase Q-like SIM isoform X1 [Branchiostoma belcheri]|uniref:DNA 3'-5' helicase n=1 Tax=Branchiostoma belcheri TaxID=7741 RepID=A0A6P4YT26_BRABE|nr:PREDICTED: ATP-dependent DNA helicase Q-like SIM isoform X1 [Branchiostoma belcheri]